MDTVIDITMKEMSSEGKIYKKSTKNNHEMMYIFVFLHPVTF